MITVQRLALGAVPGVSLSKPSHKGRELHAAPPSDPPAIPLSTPLSEPSPPLPPEELLPPPLPELLDPPPPADPLLLPPPMALPPPLLPLLLPPLLPPLLPLLEPGVPLSPLATTGPLDPLFEQAAMAMNRAGESTRSVRMINPSYHATRARAACLLGNV